MKKTSILLFLITSYTFCIGVLEKGIYINRIDNQTGLPLEVCIQNKKCTKQQKISLVSPVRLGYAPFKKLSDTKLILKLDPENKNKEFLFYAENELPEQEGSVDQSIIMEVLDQSRRFTVTTIFDMADIVSGTLTLHPNLASNNFDGRTKGADFTITSEINNNK